MRTLIVPSTVFLLVCALLHPLASPAAEPLTARERLSSCNPDIAIAAAREIVTNPETLKEPLELFSVSEALFRHGKKDEGVFWFYAAQLRMRYQLTVEPGGERGQLLGAMMMATGPIINNYALQNVPNLERILDRVMEWDQKTPNPHRGAARSEETERNIKQIYSGLRDLRTKLAADKDELERNARLAAPELERVYADAVTGHCGKGQIDPANAERATREEMALVTSFVKSHERVIQEAGGITRVYPESSLLKRAEVMPYRYIVSAIGTKTVYAVVDVSRSGGQASFTLACVSHIPSGQRDPRKDVCAQ